MIINQEGGPVVPDKTIAVFPVIPIEGVKPFNLKNINLFLNPLNLNHKRDWFTQHFYKCLPLSIGNMQGFVFSLPYDFSILWNGGNDKKDIVIKFAENYKENEEIYPNSEFGHGIVTIHYPLTFKTPPGINLMTMAPPNFLLPGLTPMVGVVESDNLRFTFTLNIKMDFSNVEYIIKKNTPLVGMIPIPRYFCDSFELKSAYDIFNKDVVEKEREVVFEHGNKREKNNQKKEYVSDKIYYLGKDVLGNKFLDHQLPQKYKNNYEI